MKITKEFLKEKGACQSGYKWFIEHFPEDDAEYQDVLNKLAECEEASHASWLLQQAGSTNDVLEIEEIKDKKHFFFSGSIVVKGLISISGSLLIGNGIEAGWSIEAGNGIEAGDGIKAGWSIKAGEGYGIFSGLRIRLKDWITDAIVSAKTKPENLVSGHFVEKK